MVDPAMETESVESKPSESGVIANMPEVIEAFDGIMKNEFWGLEPSRVTDLLLENVPPASPRNDCQPRWP